MEVSTVFKKKSSSSLLAPGFRFHPTDEELVRYYLRRRVCGKGFRFDAISDIDIYKIEPWDLPSFSKLKTRDLEWYFFSVLDKKYGNGSRTNRATEKGYWKTTGKDRAVYHKSQIVGMKKTLVFHIGRAPKGQRTNWVMHEYRLTDLELERAGIIQDAFVLCRTFQKSGSGPKNGEQYGAPFMDEDWEDDGLEIVPKVEIAEEVDFSDDAYLSGDDLEQILGSSDVPSDGYPPLNPKSPSSKFDELTTESGNDTPKLLPIAREQYNEFEQQQENESLFDPSIPYEMDVRTVKHEYIGESSKSKDFSDDSNYLLEEPRKLLPTAGEQYSEFEQRKENENLFDPRARRETYVTAVKHEYIGELSKSQDPSDDSDYLLEEPFCDALDGFPHGNGGFLEANDLTNPVVNKTSAFNMLEEYLTFFDANDNNLDPFALDPLVMLGSEDVVSDQALVPTEDSNDGTEPLPVQKGEPVKEDIGTVLPSDKLGSFNYDSDDHYSLFNKTSRILGSIPSPTSFATEFRSKDAVLCLDSLSQPSSSVDVTAGMIQIRNVNPDDDDDACCNNKQPHNVNIVLSLGFSRGDDGSATLESSLSIILQGKTATTISFYLVLFWVLILSSSFKIGTSICSK